MRTLWPPLAGALALLTLGIAGCAYDGGGYGGDEIGGGYYEGGGFYDGFGPGYYVGPYGYGRGSDRRGFGGRGPSIPGPRGGFHGGGGFHGAGAFHGGGASHGGGGHGR